jgi:hypothetical protein
MGQRGSEATASRIRDRLSASLIELTTYDGHLRPIEKGPSFLRSTCFKLQTEVYSLQSVQWAGEARQVTATHANSLTARLAMLSPLGRIPEDQKPSLSH